MDMTAVIDISYPVMLVIYAMLGVPVLLIAFLKIGILRTVFFSVLRMTLQLGLVAVYMQFIFNLNNVWINMLWILVMTVVASITVVRGSGLNLRKFFLIVFSGTSFGTVFVVLFFVVLAVRPVPLYDARYLIPITGMVLGNCLRANIISLERFYSSIKNREQEYMTFLMMGATLYEAMLPYLKEAMRSALSPILSTMATVGLVSLPGMMTGQILGGAFPVTAIKYQIGIMIAIFSAIVITSAANLLLSIRVSFNEYLILNREVFVE